MIIVLCIVLLNFSRSINEKTPKRNTILTSKGKNYYFKIKYLFVVLVYFFFFFIDLFSCDCEKLLFFKTFKMSAGLMSAKRYF